MSVLVQRQEVREALATRGLASVERRSTTTRIAALMPPALGSSLTKLFISAHELGRTIQVQTEDSLILHA